MEPREKLTIFELKALEKLKHVPRGRVTTYGALAKAIGRPGAGRAVGKAMSKNPWAPKVPCHRVVRGDGRVGGYGSGIKKKVELLRSEGVLVKNYKIINFKEKLIKL